MMDDCLTAMRPPPIHEEAEDHMDIERVFRDIHEGEEGETSNRVTVTVSIHDEDSSD